MAEEQKQEMSVREKARQDRLERIRREQNLGRVRVVPRDDDMRALMKHPVSGVGFPPTGSVEWPDDGFTKRRVEDGSVTLESQPENQTSKRGRETPPAA